MPVKVEEIIDAQSMCGNHKTIYRNIGLQGSRSADAYDVKRW